MNCAEYSRAAPTCACGKVIPAKSTAGRPRKTCGPGCTLLAPKAKYSRTGERTYECAVCHSSFEADRGRQFCGSYCKERARYLKKRPDAPARGPLTHIVERPCGNCGKVFKPRVGRYGTYCTRECAFERLAIIRRLAASPGSGQQCLVYFKSCSHCGIAWTARHKSTPVCSEVCRKAMAAAKERVRNVAKCGTKEARPCQCCGVIFTPAYGEKRTIYCSTRCLVRAIRRQECKTARKRAQKYGVEYEPVNRIRVFSRDGWRCQICGVSTPRSRMGTMARNAPELDHRVPISKRGAHTYANVQCACRACNGAKSNRNSAGQLPLFAA